MWLQSLHVYSSIRAVGWASQPAFLWHPKRIWCPGGPRWSPRPPAAPCQGRCISQSVFCSPSGALWCGDSAPGCNGHSAHGAAPALSAGPPYFSSETPTSAVVSYCCVAFCASVLYNIPKTNERKTDTDKHRQTQTAILSCVSLTNLLNPVGLIPSLFKLFL